MKRKAEQWLRGREMYEEKGRVMAMGKGDV